MKSSFYCVLCQLGWLFLLSDIPFLYDYGFICTLVIIIIVAIIISILFKKQLEYQEKCEVVFLMEMAYNNDYKKYKSQALLIMIFYTALFVYILSIFVALFVSSSIVHIIDYILLSVFVVLTGISSFLHIKDFLQVRKAGCVILDERLQNLYKLYKNDRDTCSYEEMLLPQPKHYKAINTANSIFAILSIIIGLLTIAVIYTYRGELHSKPVIVEISLIPYGVFSTYCGIKDLIHALNSQKLILLLFSCVIVLLLYIPCTNYLNKTILMACVRDYSILSYDEKSNLVQDTIIVDEISHFEPSWLRKHILIILSGQKILLKNIIRVNAEFQVIYKDRAGEEQVITIAPSELKEIYNQNKTDLDIALESLKLDLGEKSTKVYDDGEHIIIEIWASQDVAYPIQSEQMRISTWLAKYAKECAEDYNIATLNRGLKMRLIFNNDQFIETVVSLENINKLEEKADTIESEKTFNGLIDMFSSKTAEN